MSKILSERNRLEGVLRRELNGQAALLELLRRQETAVIGRTPEALTEITERIEQELSSAAARRLYPFYRASIPYFMPGYLFSPSRKINPATYSAIGKPSRAAIFFASAWAPGGICSNFLFSLSTGARLVFLAASAPAWLTASGLSFNKSKMFFLAIAIF